MEIVIYKSTKTLELREQGMIIARFPIGIGREPKGHKRTEGDGKTPEGHYVVCVKNPKSKFYLSLGLNYPNNEDARAAFNRAEISREQLDEIVRRNEEGQVPLWNTPLGGQIYIHGELESQSWSEGCIRMFNADIEYLYHRADKGLPVTILP